nr:MAG TPA: hypothetical protein [Caudoviricetes sp.]
MYFECYLSLLKYIFFFFLPLSVIMITFATK